MSSTGRTAGVLTAAPSAWSNVGGACGEKKQNRIRDKFLKLFDVNLGIRKGLL